ncbi:MAG TPA: DinB family protein [Vicinamibacterales bacterium]|jgi:uncharacterized damage-inducible protein DinB|nr:DinB family protein [Vicinamibacterales bacterium]
MKLTDLFLDELEREAVHTRHAIEQVPEGHDDWKPHDKSMPFGYLAQLVATMPGWVTMTIKQDFLDLNPPGGGGGMKPLRSKQELLQALDEGLTGARDALKTTTDDHLMKPWQLRVAGKVVSEEPRYVILRDAVFNHLAHHRGQMTVYLRLLGAQVPAIYGPSADEKRF